MAISIIDPFGELIQVELSGQKDYSNNLFLSMDILNTPIACIDLEEFLKLFFQFRDTRLLLCTIWDDVRTYLNSRIDPKEKAKLLVAISRFMKGGDTS